MTPTPAPVVYDVRDDDAWSRVIADKERYDQLTAWMRSQGLDPVNIYRIEIHPLDSPRARVYEYDRDEAGRMRLVGDDIAKREPYDLALSSLPPDAERRADS